MIVKELIEYLQTQDPNLPIYYKLYSDTRILKIEDIQLVELGKFRAGDDYATIIRGPIKYVLYERFKALLFPGN